MLWLREVGGRELLFPPTHRHYLERRSPLSLRRVLRSNPAHDRRGRLHRLLESKRWNVTNEQVATYCRRLGGSVTETEDKMSVYCTDEATSQRCEDTMRLAGMRQITRQEYAIVARLS